MHHNRGSLKFQRLRCNGPGLGNGSDGGALCGGGGSGGGGGAVIYRHGQERCHPRPKALHVMGGLVGFNIKIYDSKCLPNLIN